MLLSIIVPAFNEENNLAQTIYKFNDYLKTQNYEYEIIIVNDGSRDQTAKIANRLAAEFNYLKVINNETNLGKGAAVRKGLTSGIGRYRLFIDADDATEIACLDLAWPLLKQGFEIVIASRSHRDHPATVQIVAQTFWKRLFGYCGNIVIRLLTVNNIWDTQCGFKIFSQKALETILPKLTINRWAFDVEMLVVARKHGIKIGIIPIKWKNNVFSRVGVMGYFTSLKEVMKIKINLIKKKYD